MFGQALKKYGSDKMEGKIQPAVVINNNDPQQSQRIQARISGMHTGRPDNQIGWSIPLGWSPQGSAPGIGAYAIPSIGSKVALFFPEEDEHNTYYFADYPDSTTKIAEFTAAYPNAYGWADSAGNLWINNGSTGVVLFRHFTGSYMQYDVDGSIEVASAANILYKAVGQFSVDAAQINLNCGNASGLTITPRTKPTTPTVANMTNY